MRIVELVNNLEIGGTERLVVDLAESLQTKGHDVSVVCLRGAGPLAPLLARCGIPVIPLEKPERPNIRTLTHLVKLLRRQEIQVVHTHNPLVHHYGVVAGKLAGVPVIVNTIHGPANLSAKIKLKELIYGAVCQWTDRIIAVCPTAYRDFMNISVIPKSKLEVINNGIALDLFARVRPRDTDEIFVFGIVGRLAPVKDHRTLLEAFSRVSQSRGLCRLEILGDGPLRAELEGHTRSLGLQDKVVFHGYRADIASFMQRIDVSILCSVSEGLPLSVLEAMASGVPIIGTDVGETKDLIETATCGWVCPPSDPVQLANAMLVAMSASKGERREMGQRAQAFAIKNYSLSRMTTDYENLFHQILQTRDGKRSH